MPTKEQFGRYLEEFTVGEVIEHWPGHTITEADDGLFCMLTMNHHPSTPTPSTRPRPSSASGWCPGRSSSASRSA